MSRSECQHLAVVGHYRDELHHHIRFPVYPQWHRSKICLQLFAFFRVGLKKAEMRQHCHTSFPDFLDSNFKLHCSQYVRIHRWNIYIVFLVIARFWKHPVLVENLSPITGSGSQLKRTRGGYLTKRKRIRTSKRFLICQIFLHNYWSSYIVTHS